MRVAALDLSHVRVNEHVPKERVHTVVAVVDSTTPCGAAAPSTDAVA